MTLSTIDLFNLSENEDYVYILDLDAMTQFVREFRGIWDKQFPHVIFAYSFKSNNIASVTQLMFREGFSAEVVSLHELKLAINDGFFGTNIFFDGPVKLDNEIEFALSNNVNIQCDNITEIERVLALAANTNAEPHISLRLSSDYRGQGLSRFGMDKDEWNEAIALLTTHGILCNGIHVHSGSNLSSCQGIVDTLESFQDEIGALKNHLRFIDIGGGYPASTCGSDTASILEQYSVKIALQLRRLGIDFHKTPLILEPGRALTEDFGYLVTRIVFAKCRYSTNVITTAVPGTNIRSAQYHNHRKVLIIPERPVNCEHSVADVYGSNCYENDIMAKNVPVPFDLSLDDKIAIFSCGAYDIMNSSDWIRKRPPIIVISNGKTYYEHYRFAG